MTSNIDARILRLAAQVATKFEGMKDSAEAALFFTRRTVEVEPCDEAALEQITAEVDGWLQDTQQRDAYNDEYNADCDESYAPGHGGAQ